MRDCHISDGAALCSLLAWLEHRLLQNETTTELQVVKQLEKIHRYGLTINLHLHWCSTKSYDGWMSWNEKKNFCLLFYLKVHMLQPLCFFILNRNMDKDGIYKGPSFETIAAYGSHAAIVHYRPTHETDCQISTDNLFLLDCGSHYKSVHVLCVDCFESLMKVIIMPEADFYSLSFCRFWKFQWIFP